MHNEWTRRLLTRELSAFSRELDLFQDEALIWTTAPGISNSAGTLTLHVCGNLQYYVGTVLGNTGYLRNRDLREQELRSPPWDRRRPAGSTN